MGVWWCCAVDPRLRSPLTCTRTTLEHSIVIWNGVSYGQNVRKLLKTRALRARIGCSDHRKRRSVATRGAFPVQLMAMRSCDVVGMGSRCWFKTVWIHTRHGCSGLRVQTSTEPGPMAEAAATLSSRRQRGGVPHGARFTLGRSIHRGTGSFLVAHQPLLSTGTRMSGVSRRGMNTFPCRRVCASVDARGGWQGGTFLPEIRKVSRETK